MKYALIKDGVVKNIIVADSDFIGHIQNQWDACISLDGLDPQPGMYDNYANGQFTSGLIVDTTITDPLPTMNTNLAVENIQLAIASFKGTEDDQNLLQNSLDVLKLAAQGG